MPQKEINRMYSFEAGMETWGNSFHNLPELMYQVQGFLNAWTCWWRNNGRHFLSKGLPGAFMAITTSWMRQSDPHWPDDVDICSGSLSGRGGARHESRSLKSLVIKNIPLVSTYQEKICQLQVLFRFRSQVFTHRNTLSTRDTDVLLGVLNSLLA
jgi:hypothetical protein